jgi:hypothetical protein
MDSLSAQTATLPNFYRLGIAAEKSLLTKNPSAYGGVVIGAHYITYFQASTENFLASLGKPFFIDPMTYVFARPIDLLTRETGGMKATFEKLLSLYGRELAGIVLRGRSLTPSDFKNGDAWNDHLVNDLCENVINLQRRLLALQKRATLERLMELAEQPIMRRTAHLLFLIPPYFYAESLADDWYRVSLELAIRTQRLKGKEALYPVICMSKQVLLSEENLMRIVDDYDEFDGVVLWVSDLQDDRDGASYLRGVVKLVMAFQERGKPVYSLYGGYFFALLSKVGLTGYCSSICYGESKHVDRRATGGGLPLRYYIRHLRTKASEIDSRFYYSVDIDHLCQCTVCSSIEDVIRKEGITESQVDAFVDRFFQILSIEQAKQHFIEIRHLELTNLAQSNLRDILSALEHDYRQHEPLGRTIGKSLDPSHLRTWLEVLRELA